MKSATKLVRKYLCELCIGANPYREPKAFTRKGDLTRHQNTHTGKRAYRCNFIGCGKKFSQAAGLKTHVNVHTGEKPYTCGLGDCKSSFGDPSSCARHRKETHRRPAGYRCPVEDCKTRYVPAMIVIAAFLIRLAS
ncbi:hypothetical protein CPC08DRAFT_290027 [Agrocybe pediades]|nr:hypothetical protein CPC08DRAFT_290027 [Agrocybe pediades]